MYFKNYILILFFVVLWFTIIDWKVVDLSINIQFSNTKNIDLVFAMGPPQSTFPFEVFLSETDTNFTILN